MILGPIALGTAVFLFRSALDPNRLLAYAVDDWRLEASGVRPDVVLIGDSLTANWRHTSPRTWDPAWINRGIGGQNSHEVRARFAQDVLALHPRVVHIQVGINDIGGRQPPLTLAQTEANIADMASRARSAGIKVVLGTVEPVPDWAWFRKTVNPAGAVGRLNSWIRAYAHTTGAVCADYSVVMDPVRTIDGIHPTDAGYAVMGAVTRQALAKT
jgi:lysophospholipase L1-like esterase